MKKLLIAFSILLVTATQVTAGWVYNPFTGKLDWAGSGGGTGIPPYVSTLIAGPDSTKTITGATHGFTTTGLLVAVYDNATPRNAVAVAWTVNASTYDVVITFGSAQSNYYVVINGGVGPAGPTGATGATGTAGSTPAVTVSTSGPVAVINTGSAFYFNNAAGALTFNLPTITGGMVGYQLCFRESVTKTGAITLQAPASTFIDVNGANGIAAGTLVSGGAAGDAACVVALSTTQYAAYVSRGTWTNN